MREIKWRKLNEKLFRLFPFLEETAALQTAKETANFMGGNAPGCEIWGL